MAELDARQVALANQRRREFVKHRNADFTPRIQRLDGPALAPGDAPEVSVIIPTKDGARGGYLPKLLGQMRAQTLRRYEILTIQGDSRQGRAINTGVALARADLLIVMDDDSQLAVPETFQRLVEAMRAHPDIGMAGVENRVMADAPWLARRAMAEIPRRHSAPVQQITDSDQAEHACLAIRKDLFLAVGGENELVPRGLDPYLRGEVRAKGFRIVVIPHVWVHHIPPGSLKALVKQFWRNGVQAGYCQRWFPQWMIETPHRHTGVFPARRPVLWRAARFAGRTLHALVTVRWVYLLERVLYGAGFAYGFLTSRRPETRGA